MDTSWVCYHWATTGTPRADFLKFDFFFFPRKHPHASCFYREWGDRIIMYNNTWTAVLKEHLSSIQRASQCIPWINGLCSQLNVQRPKTHRRIKPLFLPVFSLRVNREIKKFPQFVPEQVTKASASPQWYSLCPITQQHLKLSPENVLDLKQGSSFVVLRATMVFLQRKMPCYMSLFWYNSKYLCRPRLPSAMLGEGPSLADNPPGCKTF